MTPEDWLRVQDLLIARRGPVGPGNRANAAHELDGLLCCGGCGSKLVLRAVRQGGGQFGCAGRQPDPCPKPRIDRALVEQGVDTFFRALGSADYAAASADERARLRPLIVTRLWINDKGAVDYAQHTKSYLEGEALSVPAR